MVATERRRAGRGEHADAGARRADPARWDEPRERGRRASARAPRGSNARAKRGGGEGRRTVRHGRGATPSADAPGRTPANTTPSGNNRRRRVEDARGRSLRKLKSAKKNDCDAGSVLHVSRGTLLLVDTSDDGKKRKQSQNPSLSNEKTRENRRREHILPPRLSDGPSWPPSPRHRRARRLPRSTPRPAFASRAGSRRARAADIRARAAFPRSPPRAHHRRHPPT